MNVYLSILVGFICITFTGCTQTAVPLNNTLDNTSSMSSVKTNTAPNHIDNIQEGDVLYNGLIVNRIDPNAKSISIYNPNNITLTGTLAWQLKDQMRYELIFSIDVLDDQAVSVNSDGSEPIKIFTVYDQYDYRNQLPIGQSAQVRLEVDFASIAKPEHQSKLGNNVRIKSFEIIGETYETITTAELDAIKEYTLLDNGLDPIVIGDVKYGLPLTEFLTNGSWYEMVFSGNKKINARIESVLGDYGYGIDYVLVTNFTENEVMDNRTKLDLNVEFLTEVLPKPGFGVVIEAELKEVIITPSRNRIYYIPTLNNTRIVGKQYRTIAEDDPQLQEYLKANSPTP